jgi:hypothetical protein
MTAYLKAWCCGVPKEFKLRGIFLFFSLASQLDEFQDIFIFIFIAEFMNKTSKNK